AVRFIDRVLGDGIGPPAAVLQRDGFVAGIDELVSLRRNASRRIQADRVLHRSDGVRGCLDIGPGVLKHESSAGLDDRVRGDCAAQIGTKNNCSTIDGVNAVALDGNRRRKSRSIFSIDGCSLRTASAGSVANDRITELARGCAAGAQVYDAGRCPFWTTGIAAIYGEAGDVDRSGILHKDLRKDRVSADRTGPVLLEHTGDVEDYCLVRAA